LYRLQYRDFTNGLVFLSEPRIVTGEEIIEFSSRYDPQWFHCDVVRAKKGRWEGLIASGWHTCAVAMELTVKIALKDSDTFGSPGADAIKWLHPVRPNDSLALRFEVLRLSKSPSGKTGILLARSELWNQSDRVVLSMETTTLFEISKDPAPRVRSSR
jgi:acyl dehydratase